MTFERRSSLMSSLLLITVVPAADLASDTVYLLYTAWATDTMFHIAIVAYFLPVLIFSDHLYKTEAYPMMYLGTPPDWVYFFSAEQMNSLPYVIITGITTLPWTLINLPIISVTFFTGYILYSTKLLAIRSVHNAWMCVWCGTDKFDIERPIDMVILSQSKYIELFLESIPQVVLQVINATLMDTWTDFGIVSICVSLPLITSEIYRWLYYVYGQGMKIGDVPTGLEWYVEMHLRNRRDGATNTSLDESKDVVKDDVESPQNLITGNSSAGLVSHQILGPHMKNNFDRDSDDEDTGRDEGDLGGTAFSAATTSTTSSPLHGNTVTEIELMQRKEFDKQ